MRASDLDARSGCVVLILAHLASAYKQGPLSFPVLNRSSEGSGRMSRHDGPLTPWLSHPLQGDHAVPSMGRTTAEKMRGLTRFED